MPATPTRKRRANASEDEPAPKMSANSRGKGPARGFYRNAEARLKKAEEISTALNQINKEETWEALDVEAKLGCLKTVAAGALMAIKAEAAARKKEVRELQREVADAKRQYTKYGAKVIGNAIPTTSRGKEFEQQLAKVIKRKWPTVDIDADRFRTAHRVKDVVVKGSKRTAAVIMFETMADLESLVFRPGHWAGATDVDLEASRMVTRGTDAATKSALLFLRKKDKNKPLADRRVKKMDIASDGVPVYWPGQGQRKIKVYHPDDIHHLFTPEEMAEWKSNAPGRRQEGPVSSANATPLENRQVEDLTIEEVMELAQQ